MSHQITRVAANDGSFSEIGMTDVNSIEVTTTAKGHRATVKLYYPTRQELLALADREMALIFNALHARFPNLEGETVAVYPEDTQQLATRYRELAVPSPNGATHE